MKKLLTVVLVTLSLLLALSGCTGVGDKTASISVIYAAVAVLSLVMLVGYCAVFRKTLKNNVWFVLLFSSVAIVNSGYFCLSVSASLSQALWANRTAYLGSVMLPLAMLMIILNVTNTRYKKRLPVYLFIISGVVFFVAASPGWLDIYYKEVTLVTKGGVTVLDKEYGPLHILYLFFLLGYFIAMLTVIFRAVLKKRIDSATHSAFLAIAVFVNICVWFAEQLTDIEFEMLSISYIISELFLLGVQLLINENQRLKRLVNDAQLQKQTERKISVTVDGDRLDEFMAAVETLTQTERKIFNAYIARATTKEVMAELFITENTLKFHNKNIYLKLGVRSRKELLEIYKQSLK